MKRKFSPNEKVIATWRISPRCLYFWKRYFKSFGFYILYEWIHHRVYMTNLFVYSEEGSFVDSNTTSVLYDKITNIDVKRGLGGKLFAYGHVGIQTSGSPEPEIFFKYMFAPYVFRKMVNDLRPDNVLNIVPSKNFVGRIRLSAFLFVVSCFWLPIYLICFMLLSFIGIPIAAVLLFLCLFIATVVSP